MDLPVNQIICGDCLEVMKELSDNSIDAVVTDPPYGLSKEPDITEVLTKWINGEPYDHGHGGFMGKKWDSFVPHPDIWKEVYRVLKPGGHALVFAGTRTQDLMTISLRLAGFEVRDVIEWIYFCLSDDTQALTREGWKSYKELTEDDYVMQWDSETGEMSWVKPEAIHVFPYIGKMLNFKSASTDQLVTPNHRMYVDVKKHSRNEYAGKYEVYEAKDLKRHWHKRFPLAGTYEGDKSIGINRAKLLGWFLTDAWIHNDGKAVMFSQSKPETLKKLRAVLDKSDVTYSEYTKKPKKDVHNVEHTFYVTGKDVDWLLDNYGDRRFNNELLDLVVDERKALLESLIDGDGSRSEEGLLTFWSMDEDFRNFVRQLMFTLNMRTSVDNRKGCVRGSTRFNDTELQHKHGIQEVDYEGDVWCVTVPKGAFVVKRNEHVFITGNSGFPKSHDVSKAFDKRAGAERVSLGKVKGAVNPKGYKHENGVQSGGAFKSTYDITSPTTELARKWDGWGTSLKPSHEPVILGTKPLPFNYKLGILVMETITRILGGPICQRLNVSISDAARLFMYFLPQLERVGVNTVAESAKIRNWASGEFVRLVERNFTPNGPELSEENLNTVQRHAPILLEGVRVKKTPTGKADDLNERTGTLLSEPMTESIGLNTMLSWSNILAVLLKKASMFTTETESKMITELKTLNWLLGQNTQRNTTQANGILNAGLPCDVTTVDAILSDVKRKYLDTENSFAQELVISKGSEQESQTDHQSIIMARKPLDGTVADNVERWGTGAINIDASRIAYLDDLDKAEARPQGRATSKTSEGMAATIDEGGDAERAEFVFTQKDGRFPANCITLDSDEFYSKYFNVTPQELSKKASKKDRNSDWQGEEIALDAQKVGYGGNEYGMNANKYRPDGSERKPITHKNNHPTVKPTDLMAWLVRLVTPPNGIVLDPFAGSGSTCVAAKREGFDYIGIEMTPEYMEIARARCGLTTKEEAEEPANKQVSLF